jgi:hypothetical protein
MMIYGVQLYKLNPEKYILPDNLKSFLLDLETSHQQQQQQQQQQEQQQQ